MFSAFGKDAAGGFSKSFTDAFKGGAIGGAVGAGLVGVFTGVIDKLVSIATAGGKAVASAFEASLNTGIDLQRVENEFQGVAQATGAQMDAMRKKARELGSDVTLPGVSTSQASKAMTALVKDGFSVEQSINGVRGVLELATAGQLEAADAAEILGDNINMFGLHATDATRVADIFASTVNASSVSMRDMQLAMSMGGSMAHGFGMSIEQTAAALGALGQMGIKGSDAGTLMKTMLKQLVTRRMRFRGRSTSSG
jgi:TP901 family phage tail tape measure protein